MMNISLKLHLKFHPALMALLVLALLAVSSQGQGQGQSEPVAQSKTPVPSVASDNSPAEDFSGMYSFLKEGEFIQITVDKDGISGYISRQGDQDSDRGVFLDQWFSKVSIKAYDAAFATKPLHSVWFEFKGVFSRGPAKTKAQDGYYVLRGTLTKHVADADGKDTARSTQVDFKLLAEAQENKRGKD
jgi:hypothetical protein